MSDIRRFLDYLFDDNEVFEVCLLGASGKHRLVDNQFIGKSIVAGWFDDKKKAVEVIQQADAEIKPTAIYTTLNPCVPALLGRAANRLNVVKSRTSDKEIADIRNLLIDIDPQRPAGISSTADELAASMQLTRDIYRELTSRGWPQGMCCESGNGHHLIFKLAVGDPELTKAFLGGLAETFSNSRIAVDTTVFNPARLVKISGTWARKGDNIPSRPHRQSKITYYPERALVEPSLLLPYAESGKKAAPAVTAGPRGDKLDVPRYLSDYGRVLVGEKRLPTGTMYLLEACVFDSSHTGKESAIVQDDGGKLSYHCFHNSCQGKTWQEARQIISGSAPLSAVSAVSAISSSVSSLSAKCQQSVSKNQAPTKEAIYQEIKSFVLENSGTITTREIDAEFCLWERAQKNMRSAVLRNLKNQGLIDKHPTKTGHWRIKNDNLEVMDLFGADATPVYLPLPLGLSDMVKLYPKTVIIVAGSSNAGKSAFAAHVAHSMYNGDNCPARDMASVIDPGNDEVETWYFNSEASAEELRDRWGKYPGGIESWRKVKPVFRTRDFQDVIRPNAVNIVDYLEVYDNFWEIGGWIKEIFDKLEKGIAIILIQKKTGSSTGRGGDITMEKSRLYVALENNYPYGQICKVVKAKSFTDPERNPNGLEIDFDLPGGWDFREKSEWRVVDEKDRARINLGYRCESSNGLDAFSFRLVGGHSASLSHDEFKDLQDQFIAVDVVDILDKARRKGNRKPFLEKEKWYDQVLDMLRKETNRTGKQPTNPQQHRASHGGGETRDRGRLT